MEAFSTYLSHKEHDCHTSATVPALHAVSRLINLKWPSGNCMMFLGFRFPCMMPCRWMCSTHCAKKKPL